jgi:hypothetical protein
MTRWSAWILALALSGCGASMKSYQPVNEKTKHSEDDLYTASVAALEARDYVAIQDRERYLVETREKEVSVSSVPRLSYKYTWQIQTREGSLSIISTCKENSSTDRTKFEDCGDERPDKLVKEQEDIRQDILMRAKTATAPDRDLAEKEAISQEKDAEKKDASKKDAPKKE